MRRRLERLWCTVSLPRHRTTVSWTAFACTAVGFGLLSALVGQDSNWDLRNYHFYGPWAFVNGRLDVDLAPAQLQTYLNPMLDLPMYWMVAARWPARVVAFVMGLPAGIATFVLGKILLLGFADLPPARRWLMTGFALLGGITATMPVALLGTTMNEWQVAMLVLIAVWAIATHPPTARAASWPYWLAGTIAGIAAGLKLSSAQYAVGMAVAVFAFHVPMQLRIQAAARYVAGAALGLALSLGPWAWMLFERFDSPLYPFFNEVFRSPWWDPEPVVPHVFGPKTAFEWLVFPLRMASTTEMYVTEMPMRDWRFAILFVAMWLAAAAWWRHRLLRAPAPVAPGNQGIWHFLLTFFAVSFVTWAVTYSVLRYALTLQLLATGLTLYLLRWCIPTRWMSVAGIAVVAMSIATARYTHWGHFRFAERYIEAEVPDIPAGAAVFLLTPEPMAYVLPFFRHDARFVGLDNNLVNPGQTNRMQEAVRAVVDGHPGPLYSLTRTTGTGQDALDAYGLRKTGAACASIRTNIDKSPLELCRIERRSR